MRVKENSMSENKSTERNQKSRTNGTNTTTGVDWAEIGRREARLYMFVQSLLGPKAPVATVKYVRAIKAAGFRLLRESDAEETERQTPEWTMEVEENSMSESKSTERSQKNEPTHYWSCKGAHGSGATWEEVRYEMERRIGFPLEELAQRESEDGGTTYYYLTEAEADADIDGAYACQVSEENPEREELYEDLPFASERDDLFLASEREGPRPGELSEADRADRLERMIEEEEPEEEVEENPMSGAKTKREELYEDLFVSAIEGGSNYWYYLPDASMVPKGPAPLSIRIFSAVMDGAEVPVTDVNDATPLGFLTRTGMKHALEAMKVSYSDSRGRILSGDWDSSDADAWFQFAVMGKAIYG